MPKILIVSYAYPRAGAGWGGVVGGERMFQFARQLPAHGIETCVLTHCVRSWERQADAAIYAALDVTRWLAETLRAATFQRGASGPPTGDAPLATADSGEATPSTAGPAGCARPHPGAPRGGWGLSTLRTRARRWLVPDRASFAWAPLAMAAGVRVFERERPDLVLSSSPPIAAHLVACALATRFGVPWIADVRDGYAFEPPEGRSPVRGARRALERQLYAQAARVLAVTDALRDDFRSFLPLPAAHVVTLNNGYDADLIHATPLPPRAADAPCTILYAGSTSFGAGRDLAGFLRGVDQFAAHAQGPVRVRLMGLFAARELPALQHAKLEQTGWRPRAEVAESLQAADVLAVLTGNHASVATTKLFEYIGAGRPILVVGRASAAARIVLEHQCGVVADDAPESIAGALAQLHAQRERWRAVLSSEAAASRRRGFSRQGQAAALAGQIRDVLAASSR